MHRNSMNKAIIVGRVGQDPEKRATQTGTAVSNFSLATNESIRDQSGQTTELTEWHRCVAFGKTAEFINSYVTKGRLVYVDGRLRTRKWTDNNNVTHYSTEIHVDTAMLLDRRDSNDSYGDIQYDQSRSQQNSGDSGGTRPPAQEENHYNQTATDAEGDELPF